MRQYKREYENVEDGLDDYFGTGKINVSMEHHDESFCFKYTRKWEKHFSRQEDHEETFYISPDEVFHFVKYMTETDELGQDEALRKIKELLNQNNK